MGLPGRGHSCKMIKQTKKPKNGKTKKQKKPLSFSFEIVTSSRM
jgi:hypothetical protein